MTDPVLYIDCAIHCCSVAVGDSTHILAFRKSDIKHSAAEMLHILIKEAMEESGCTFRQLKAVCISGGPGSYTGIRIAAAAAKGFCFGLDIPLIQMSTLEMMVEGAVHRYAKEPYTFYIPMIDARRMEVFCGIYQYEKGRGCRIISSPDPQIITTDSFKDLEGKGEILLFGDGTGKCIPLLERNGFHCWEGYSPSAEDLIWKGAYLFQQQHFEDLASFEPFYLKACHFK